MSLAVDLCGGLLLLNGKPKFFIHDIVEVDGITWSCRNEKTFDERVCYKISGLVIL